MTKSIVDISKCKTGDMLGEDILNYNGIKIVSKNTIINEYIKKRLEELGIFKVYIYDKDDHNKNVEYLNFKKEYHDIITSTQELISHIFTEKEIIYNEVISITNSIYNKAFDTDCIMKYMLDLQSADQYTFSHSVNVAFYSMLIGRWMKMPEDKMKELIQAGILHDIGKMKVDSKILNKPAKLTYEEFEEMKKHPLYGYDIVKETQEISDNTKKAILLHHERMDGSGYPYNLSENKINLCTKIIAIADTYDAMTSNRVYKRKVTPFKAFNMFLTEGLSLYDVEILNVFLSNISLHYIGSNVLLSNGERGKIVYIPPYDILSPIVKVGNNYLDFSRKSNDIRIEEVTI